MDTFQNIGAGLAILLLVFQLFDRIPVLRRFFLNSLHWLKETWKMFREWRWWRQYSPVCEVPNFGELRITKRDSNTYDMELKIEIKYKSRDNRHDTEMDITAVYLDIASTGKGRDSGPYRLSRSSHPNKIYPLEEEVKNDEGWYPVINEFWKLLPMSEVIIRYLFFKQVEALPLVDTLASCKMIEVGKAKIYGINQARMLKTPKTFTVRVNWQN